MTPLHRAVWDESGDGPSILAAVLKLLKAGADVNAKTANGRTPLHFAVQSNPALALLDDFYKARADIKLVLSRSEQHASIMAQAYGKVTGTPAVLMGMGPFLTTTGAFGILEAYFAGSPMVLSMDWPQVFGLRIMAEQ